MEMHKSQGAGMRRDIGTGKTCLMAIDPEYIRRRLAPRGEIASAQCRMVKNRSRHALVRTEPHGIGALRRRAALGLFRPLLGAFFSHRFCRFLLRLFPLILT